MHEHISIFTFNPIYACDFIHEFVISYSPYRFLLNRLSCATPPFAPEFLSFSRLKF